MFLMLILYYYGSFSEKVSMGVNGGEVRGNEARMAEGAEKFRGQLAGAMGRQG